MTFIDQYRELKKQYPDTIVLMRLGDFYEAFEADAEAMASACDLTLRTRKLGPNKSVPMAGVPYFSVNDYVTIMNNSGYTVAVCDQVSEIPVNGVLLRKGA